MGEIDLTYADFSNFDIPEDLEELSYEDTLKLGSKLNKYDLPTIRNSALESTKTILDREIKRYNLIKAGSYLSFTCSPLLSLNFKKCCGFGLYYSKNNTFGVSLAHVRAGFDEHPELPSSQYYMDKFLEKKDKKHLKAILFGNSKISKLEGLCASLNIPVSFKFLELSEPNVQKDIIIDSENRVGYLCLSTLPTRYSLFGGEYKKIDEKPVICFDLN